jgi:TolA-binding protein
VESLTKRYQTPILVTASTQSELPVALQNSSRFIDRVRVAGHAEPVDVFEVFAADFSDRSSRLSELRPDWQVAVDLYYSRRFSEAHTAFRSLLEKLPGDVPALLFEARARRLMSDLPGAHWTGIEILQEK